MPKQIPVLLTEVIKYFDPKANENFIDCTIGEGGHSLAILEKIGPAGKILGIDIDPNQIENCKRNLEKYKERLILENGNYADLEKIILKNNFRPIEGILLDLGFSSFQIEAGKRGFSFLRDEPLDMRYDDTEIANAWTIINEWDQEEIKKILEEYGEEKFAKQISREIYEQRKLKKINSTFDLVRIIESAVPSWYKRGKIHFATRTFQALRIAVNNELENLKIFLPQAISALGRGGRLAIISFHSLEDRIVKNFFKEESKKGLIKLLVKKPIAALPEEIFLNSRARSAKLRIAIKI